MSIGTRPPAHRLPRFGLLQAADSPAVLDSNGLDVTTTTEAVQLERLRDGLQGYKATFTAGAQPMGIDLDRNVSAELHRPGIERLAILGGNLYDVPVYFQLLDDAAGFIDYVDGGNIVEMGMPGPIHWIDNLSDNGGTASANVDDELNIDINDSAVATQPEIGELYYTRMLQPTSGIARQWTWDIEENISQTTTEGSAIYTLVRGPSRRVFSIEHRMVTLAELSLYQAVIAHAAQGRPFLYDSPESGDVVWDRIVTDTLGDWSLNPGGVGTLAQQTETIHDQQTEVIEHTADAVTPAQTHGFQAAGSPLFPSPEDWTEYFLSIDIRSTGPSNAWMSAGVDNALRLRLANADNRSTTWTFMDVFAQEPPPQDRWVRLYLDPSSTAHFSAVSGTLGGVDLRAVNRFNILWLPTLSSDVLQAGHLRFIDKRKRPTLVTLVPGGHSIVQDSPVPASGEGPTYTVRLDMIEALG